MSEIPRSSKAFFQEYAFDRLDAEKDGDLIIERDIPPDMVVEPGWEKVREFFKQQVRTVGTKWFEI